MSVVLSTPTKPKTGIVWDAILYINCFLNVPMWSMLINVFVYCGTLRRTWSSVFVRSSLLYYAAWIAFDHGGDRLRFLWPYRASVRLRKVFLFRWIRDYFPITLHKTVNLPSKHSTSYIFTYHPHGIIGMGCNGALNTEACQFDTLFPGIERYAVTLNASFLIPFFREWIIALGFLGADRSILKRTLDRGASIVLVPGGASEALHTASRTFRLKRRQGFIRLALETNSQVVPCLAFGENDAFGVVQLSSNTWAFNIQQRLCKLLSFSTPILSSPFCKRTPIDVVVGKPIVFKATASIEDCTDQYCRAVEKLYHDHKIKFRHGNCAIEWI